MFIQTEATPNPATLKFIPRPHGARQRHHGIFNREAASRSPLAERLFAVPGVTGVFYGSDFVTVTKDGQRLAAPQARDPRRDHGALHVRRAAASPTAVPAATSAATRKTSSSTRTTPRRSRSIKDLIETRVRPAVANDGGDITFRGFKDGIVYLNMKGSCAGCPSSTATLQHGIQNLLRHFVPDVVEVRPM